MIASSAPAGFQAQRNLAGYVYNLILDSNAARQHHAEPCAGLDPVLIQHPAPMLFRRFSGVIPSSRTADGIQLLSYLFSKPVTRNSLAFCLLSYAFCLSTFYFCLLPFNFCLFSKILH